MRRTLHDLGYESLGRLLEDDSSAGSVGTTGYSQPTNSTTTSTSPSWWETLSSAASSVVSGASDYYAQAQKLVSSGMDKAYASLEETKALMEEVIGRDDEIDAKIAAMPESAEKERLKKKRDENKGYFGTYVLPAWKKFAAFVGLSDSPRSSAQNMQFGAVPLVPIAAVVAALSLSYVAKRYFDLQEDIFEDPDFTAAQKIGLMESFSAAGLTKFASEFKWPLIIGGAAVLALVVAYQLNVAKKAHEAIR